MTQQEIVAQALADAAKTIKEVHSATGILEPNIRRILGQGEKKGVFSRLARGVYSLVTVDGTCQAYIECAAAEEALPKLVEQGWKFDSVFLDPPYFSKALVGGSRGIKQWNFITPEEFGEIGKLIPSLLRSDRSQVYLMLSGAPTAQVDMKKYLDALTSSSGLQIIQEGRYRKLFRSGKPVTNVRGLEAAAERLVLLSLSGEIDAGEKPVRMSFEAIRPTVAKSYSTEKAPSFISAIVRQATKTGQWMLDLFAGSGVLGEECIKSGRHCYLIEKLQSTVDEWIHPRLQNAFLKHSS